MAKTRCVICKAFNAKAEIGRHPNETTLGVFRFLIKSLVSRDPVAIEGICQEHRNPLQFVTCVTSLSATCERFYELGKSCSGLDWNVRFKK